jgi:hypothetical protein
MNNEIEITNKPIAPAKNLKFIELFSWFWSVITCLYIFCVTFLPLNSNGKDFAQIVLGFLLGTAVATILGYYYGSSIEKGK